MARLSATTALLLAAVAFLIVSGAAEAGQPHNGDAITKDFIFARGIKLHVAKQGTATDHIFAGGSKLSVARHDAAAADHASARGSKLDVTQSKVSIPLMSKLAVPKMRLAVSESKVSIPLMSKLAVPKMRLAVSQSKVSIPLMSKIAVPKSRLAVSQKVSIPLMSKIAIPKSRLAVSESKVSVPKKDFIFSEGRKLSGGAAADTAGAAPGALQACDQLEAYQRVCHTLLHLPGVTTPRALLETAVRVALGRARAAKVTFDAAKLASGTGNPMASILGSCEQNYDDLVDALEGVSRAMQKPGATGESLVTKMTAASTYAGDCDNWYEERDVKSPYEVMQRHLAQMVSVALGLANKIKKL